MRVLIVVDNALTAEAIRREMRHMPSCKVIGYVNGRVSCAMAVAEANPDLVLVDDMSERQTTLSRIRDVRAAVPAAKIVLLTVRMDGDWLAETASAGVNAAISKATPPSSVGLLVRAVATGNVYHAFEREPAATRMPASLPMLTARELEILQWVAAGASNSAIARELFVTEQTVKFHLSNVYRKLSVANRTEASHYAHVHGLIDVRTTAAPVHLSPVRAAA